MFAGRCCAVWAATSAASSAHVLTCSGLDYVWMGVVSWAQHSGRVFRFEEDPWGRPNCQSAFNGDTFSSSNCDPPPGRGTGGEAPPPGQPAGTIHPNPFHADHPWLPFLRCPMRRSCYSQRAGSNSDAESTLHGSSLHAFQQDQINAQGFREIKNRGIRGGRLAAERSRPDTQGRPRSGSVAAS